MLLCANEILPHKRRAAKFRKIAERILEALNYRLSHFVCGYGRFTECYVSGADSAAYGIAHCVFYLCCNCVLAKRVAHHKRRR